MFGTDKEPNATTSYVAGVGVNSTYNKILGDAKTRCNGEFKILDSKAKVALTLKLSTDDAACDSRWRAQVNN